MSQMSDFEKGMLLLAWAFKMLELARRALSGNPVTDEEIKSAGTEVSDSIGRWDAAGQ